MVYSCFKQVKIIPMHLKINGSDRETSAPNLLALLDELGIPAPTVIIEHNYEIFKKEQFANRNISEGDNIEIVRFAPGG